MKIALLGGGGVRTPLLIHGLTQAREQIGVSELALYDVDRSRVELMAALGHEITRGTIAVTVAASLEQAIDGATFVLSSLRVGGIAARAQDERIAIAHGLVGQETTGPGGLAMALRTVPVALEQARLIERYAPDAYLINFTNPAGLITQALRDHTKVRAIGICDTPSELFHHIAEALGEFRNDLEFTYAGLNHLGWVSRILLRGQDVMPRLLADEQLLLRLYPARLFEPAMIRTLGLIPSEYLFFLYARGIAFRNQQVSGASRGAELQQMNNGLFERLRAGTPTEAVLLYKEYLNQRNASYMRLEAHGESANQQDRRTVDPFDAATGYHRIAIDTMAALCGDSPASIVLNVRNHGAISDLATHDVVEVPCLVDRNGPRPLATGTLPAAVRGVVLAVKEYERLAIRAAIEGSLSLAKLALLVYPIVGEWEPASTVLDALVASDPKYLGYLRG